MYNDSGQSRNTQFLDHKTWNVLRRNENAVEILVPSGLVGESERGGGAVLRRADILPVRRRQRGAALQLVGVAVIAENLQRKRAARFGERRDDDIGGEKHCAIVHKIWRKILRTGKEVEQAVVDECAGDGEVGAVDEQHRPIVRHVAGNLHRAAAVGQDRAVVQ